MSAVLPIATPLGKLTFDEVFVEYDGPKLFSARNAAGQRYLAVAVDDSETGETFLWAPVSEGRYLAVRSGLTPLQDVFLRPEESVFVVDNDYVAASYVVNAISSSEISDDWLPDKQAVINLRTDTNVKFQASQLEQRSNEETRTLFALELDRPDLMRTEYPLRDLQELLGDVQEAVHAMAAEAEGKATSAGAIPEYIVRDSELSLVDLQAASFVVILAPTLGDRIVEMPLATLAADRLLEVIGVAGDAEAFRGAINGLEKRALSKLRSLMQSLVDTNASLKAYLARPGVELLDLAVSAGDAMTGLHVLAEQSTTSREILAEKAVLIGANVRTRAFELRDDASGEKYAGKIDAGALDQVEGLQLGEGFRYSARVLVEESFGSASAEPKAKHRLLMIRRVLEGNPDWDLRDD